MEQRIPFVLTAYGMPHMMGWLADASGRKYAEALDTSAFIAAAADLGVAGIEMPLPKEADARQRLRDALDARGMRVVADYMAVLDADAETMRDALRAAAEIGSPVLRACISRILCGDRRTFEGGWPAHLEAVAARLREVLPLAEDLGVAVALENHQDATTEDLLDLHERTGRSPSFGITLDAGNPLAVAQEPVEAARQLAPIIRHIHLKDYTIHFAPEGYRLVRCAAGDGVVDFPEILRIVRANGHDVLPGIEIAAQATRTIPLLEDGWWACYPPRLAAALLGALRILWRRGRPIGEPYSSAWERGEPSEVVAAEEWDIVQRSVDYFRGIA